VVQVAVGTAHSCALHEDGRVSCWGDNHYGQLGISPTPDAGALAPALIPETQLANAVHISSSRNHTCAVRQDGLVKCWGQDAMGALGDGGGSGEGVVEVLVIDDAEVVAAGSSHTCVARKSGAFSCWGSNSDGQLGLGTFGNMHAAPAGDVIDLP
jgi:alpha-tubulin suppressor-like RCC1 family protein